MLTKPTSTLSWLTIFTFLYLLSYLLTGLLFGITEGLLPIGNRLALDFYQPFDLTDPLVLFGHGLRGLTMALVLLHFRSAIPEDHRGSRILFGLLWGLSLLLSLEPQPGSIEGMIYLQATIVEHGLVLLFTAGQIILFIALLQKVNDGLFPAIFTGVVEQDCDDPDYLAAPNKKKPPYLRWTLIYVVVYWTVGILFYNLSGYQEALATMEELSLFRPLENIPAVIAVFAGQFVRGPLLLLFLWPLRERWLKKRKGWPKLFLLLIGFSVFGTYGVLPSITAAFGRISPQEFISELTFGLPELFFQLLIFSFLIVKLLNHPRRRKQNRIRKKDIHISENVGN